MAHKLSFLLNELALLTSHDDCLVQGLCVDSRRVAAGDLFIARKGAQFDGLSLATDAVARGAVAVLAGHGDAAALRQSLMVPVLVVDDLVQVLGVVADRFYDEPSKALRVIGVTGTNGKTSISHFIAQALNAAGKPAGVIGTLGMGLWGGLLPATHTTPDVIAVHAELARQRDLGVQYVVMEVSSHALDQGRVEGVRFRAAVFSNLSHDHLDYHADMARYAQAKSRLFMDLAPRAAIINMDDVFGRELLERLQGRVSLWAYGLGETPWAAQEAFVLTTRALRLHTTGSELDLMTPQGAARLRSSLLGRFNACNLLAALAVLLELGMPLADALAALAQVEAPAGRMERFSKPGKSLVVVDYAHTPDALAQALSTLRAHLHAQEGGKLCVVFGCGGDRDRSKRALMGQVASELADQVILTDDNPRHEDAEDIVADIKQGIVPLSAVRVERDRRQAIQQALAAATPLDIILVAGKGHEDYQEIGGVRHAYSDRDTVRTLMEDASC
jgi:UDP-N-acetylmuramoyl-L-alanyl-D-glutamate--2,6-diaminopimelate ligase